MKRTFCYALLLLLLKALLIHGNDGNDIVDFVSDEYEHTLLQSSTENSTAHQQQSQRQLQFGRSVVCNPTDTDTKTFWETTVINNARRNYYLEGRGAVPGSCVDSCAKVCNHKPCYTDNRIVQGDDCQCLSNSRFNCGPNSGCNETADTCACNKGYEGSPASTTGCTDVNECSSDSLNDCGPDTICTNLEGDYSCACKQGFSGIEPRGSGCSDINECTSNICGQFSVSCTNTPGGYSCACRPGFTWSGAYGTGCVNINECLQGICGEGAICTDTQGSYKCACKNGYRGNPPQKKCTDQDECKERKGICGPNAICTNTPGFFRCQCEPGYLGNPPTGADCKPTKCKASGVTCGANAFCVEETGLCTCPPGFGGPNVTIGGPCSEIDECASNPCPPSAPICENLVGSFRCVTDIFGACSSGTDCVTGICAQLSRSDNSLVCCAEAEECSPGLGTQCCNGAYGIGEPCPSRNAKDCESPFKCGRKDRSSNTYVCCRNTFTPILDPFPVCN